MKLCSLAILVGVLIVLPARAEPGAAAAKGGSTRSSDYAKVVVKGQFRKVAGAEGESTGFQISANAVAWEVDASANKTLLQTAEQLDGKPAIASGTYAERRGVSRVRRILVAEALKRDAGTGSGEYIDVTVHGTLKTGVMAIGAETTGVTITFDKVTWDLDLEGGKMKVAGKLNGRKATISGRVGYERGIEVRNRVIVKVRSIKSSN